MSFETLNWGASTARQTLIESSGTPFAPAGDVRPVVKVIDGRLTNDDLDPVDWIRALEAGEGAVAIYFYLAADHEWWLAYDPDAEDDTDPDRDRDNRPFHRWTTYPSGGWDHRPISRGVLQHNLDDIYWVHDPAEKCDIHRSKVVRLEDAPTFVRREVTGRD